MVKLPTLIGKFLSLRPKNFRCPRIVLSWQNVLLTVAILAIPVFGYYLWHVNTTIPGLDDFFKKFPTKMGQEVSGELRSAPAIAFKQEADAYTVTDDDSTGIRVEYPNRPKGDEQNPNEPPKDTLKLSFPNDYSKPLEVDLGQGKKFRLTDQGAVKGYRSELLDSSLPQNGQGSILDIFTRKRAEEMHSRSKAGRAPVQDILSYRSPDGRKTILYSYRADGAMGAKKLKNWTIFAKGNGSEEEKYVLDGATAKINDSGDLDIFLRSEQDIKNEAATAQVSPSLLERAKKTLEKESGAGAMDGNRRADLTIPKPYYVDKDGNHYGADWAVSDGGKTFSVSIGDASGRYPIALDPTLSFTASGQSDAGGVITGNATGEGFGYASVAGDFNADGRTDMAISSPGYNPGSAADTGRVYVFYNDGLYSTTASGADVAITGGTAGDRFGETLTAGDFNADGKTDLVIGSVSYNTNAGRAYVYYQNSRGGFNASLPASAANVTYTGSSGDQYGWALAAGDFNSDGKTDLAVSAPETSTFRGSVYLYYQQSSGGLATLSWTITGAATNTEFGSTIVTGDFNADGKTDLAVSANAYTGANHTGRAYIIYQDSGSGFSISTASAGGVVLITGEASNNYFCGGGSQNDSTIVAGDFNADGKTDLACGASEYSGGSGRTYIFYQPSSGGFVTVLASAANVKIDAGPIPGFGYKLAAGDFNTDGRIDLVASAIDYGTQVTSHIFYNDGSYAANADSADVIIYGSSADTQVSPNAFAVGDFNADGKTDLAVGAADYSSNAGRTYIFYSQNGMVNTNFSISGTTMDQALGARLATGDFDSDGRDDLVAADMNDHIYVFLNDGASFPTTSSGADVTIGSDSGGAYSLAIADFNRDGTADIAIGEMMYDTAAGRVAIVYNDGSWPASTDSANVLITAPSPYDGFGANMVSGDFNTDGRTDLAVASPGWDTGSEYGRIYVFNNDGAWPTVVSSADAIITGTDAGDTLGGWSEYQDTMASGDFNADGRTDLVVGAPGDYTAQNDGLAYVFYGGSITTENASSADIVLSGATNEIFGSSVAVGDFNTDGKSDLAVGAGYEGGATLYVFYSLGSSNPSTWASSAADESIAGVESYHEPRLLPADFNADGRMDLIASNLTWSGSYYFSRTWVFYNDGSYPSSATEADVVIDSGEMIGDGHYETALVAGDFNDDGRNDFAIGEPGLGANGVGQINFYTARENFAWTTHPSGPPGGMNVVPGAGQEVRIVGEGGQSGYNFGDWDVAAGDLNADGKTDLVVGTPYFSGEGTPNGRLSIFYDDGSIPSSAASADVVITGSGNYSYDYLGWDLSTGDMNGDGRTDLVAAGLNDVWIFHNDGSYPDTVAGSDFHITGNRGSGGDIVTGDFNADGRTDLAVGDSEGGTNGRVCGFVFDGSVPTTLDTADVIVSGELTDGVRFGGVLEAGDFNADGKTDIAVADANYGVDSNGRVYLFFNGSIATMNASAANVIIDTTYSNGYFGRNMVSGDFNADGRADLSVGEGCSHTNWADGCAYIFYNDGSYPATVGSADVTIRGNNVSDNLGTGGMTAGDFNGDGKTDLAVASVVGVNIFYNDGSYPATDAFADVRITPSSANGDHFGATLTAGDFNADGRADIAVGDGSVTVNGYVNTGAISIYTFNDSAGTGDAGSNFGYAMTAGDFNSDGKTDLAVGAYSYSSNAGRAYIFYNDGSLVSNLGSASADVTITGEASSKFGISFTQGDFNSDGRTDFVVGALDYSSSTGRTYIFYNDGSIPTTAASADIKITGEASSNFGYSLAAGDFNADGKTDLAVGAWTYASDAGRTYIFYNDGSIPTTAASADVIITGEASSLFGITLTSGDFDIDGKTDLVVGADAYSSDAGRAYIFYQNSGGGFTTPLPATSANVIITGESSSNFSYPLVTGDFNVDGKTDLAVGAYSYTSSAGRTYIFYNDGSIPTTAVTADVIITGEASSAFGVALSSGDFNADGKTDLAVGAREYSSNTGRAYIFYNDGSIPTTATMADVIMTGEAAGDYYGVSFTSGDLNTDGKTDLAVGAHGYSSDAGRAYIVITESRASDSMGEPVSGRGNFKFRGNVRTR
jgi:hypothetical protein